MEVSILSFARYLFDMIKIIRHQDKENLINFSLQHSGIVTSYLSGVNQTIISVESNLILLRNEISAEWINQKESNLK